MIVEVNIEQEFGPVSWTIESWSVNWIRILTGGLELSMITTPGVVSSKSLLLLNTLMAKSRTQWQNHVLNILVHNFLYWPMIWWLSDVPTRQKIKFWMALCSVTCINSCKERKAPWIVPQKTAVICHLSLVSTNSTLLFYIAPLSMWLWGQSWCQFGPS